MGKVAQVSQITTEVQLRLARKKEVDDAESERRT
jgi:hypothetical protein